MEQTKAEIAKVQKEQLQKGIDRNDAPIKPPYAASTIRKKIKKGQPTDRVTFYDTGRAYSEMVVDVRQDVYVVDMNVPYAKHMYDRSTQNIVGLGREARQEYILSLKPILISKVREQLR